MRDVGKQLWWGLLSMVGRRWTQPYPVGLQDLGIPCTLQ